MLSHGCHSVWGSQEGKKVIVLDKGESEFGDKSPGFTSGRK